LVVEELSAASATAEATTARATAFVEGMTTEDVSVTEREVAGYATAVVEVERAPEAEVSQAAGTAEDG
jgi:hypothetical protein